MACISWSNTILRIYIILKMLVLYDNMSELKVLIGQGDLYLMVQCCYTKLLILKASSHKAHSIVF